MNKAPTSTPHDAVFKTFLRHPETARDFLQIHLPASLRELCDLQTLKCAVVGEYDRREWIYLCGD